MVKLWMSQATTLSKLVEFLGIISTGMVKREIKLRNERRSENKNWETKEIKSKSCASGSWGFGFHVTESEGLLEETGNQRQEKNNAKVYSPWISAYPKKSMLEV